MTSENNEFSVVAATRSPQKVDGAKKSVELAFPGRNIQVDSVDANEIEPEPSVGEVSLIAALKALVVARFLRTVDRNPNDKVIGCDIETAVSLTEAGFDNGNHTSLPRLSRELETLYKDALSARAISEFCPSQAIFFDSHFLDIVSEVLERARQEAIELFSQQPFWVEWRIGLAAVNVDGKHARQATLRARAKFSRLPMEMLEQLFSFDARIFREGMSFTDFINQVDALRIGPRIDFVALAEQYVAGGELSLLDSQGKFINKLTPAELSKLVVGCELAPQALLAILAEDGLDSPDAEVDEAEQFKDLSDHLARLLAPAVIELGQDGFQI